MRTNIVVSILVILLSSYMGFNYGISVGSTRTVSKYNTIIEEHNKEISRLTTQLNLSLSNKATDLSAEIDTLLKDTAKIKAQLKSQKQPLVVVQDGKCVLSPDLLSNRQELIKRVNEK